MYTAHDILSILAFKPFSPSYPQEREREEMRKEMEVRKQNSVKGYSEFCSRIRFVSGADMTTEAWCTYY